jgi:GNAT superfamily N-acetyltransferase
MCTPLPAPERLESIEAITFADEFAAAPPAVVAAAGLGFEWVGDTLVAWASRVDVLMFNRAFPVGQSRPVTADALGAIAQRFDARGVPRSFLQIAPGARPAELVRWLGPLGWQRHNRWAKFARPLEQLPPLPEHVRVDVIGADRADDFGRVLVESFRMPPPMRAWQAALVGRPRWRHYLACVEGETVGCAAMFTHDGLASLGQAGTLEHARGRGVQGALIARRLRDAAGLGCTHAVVETAEDLPDKPAPSFRNQLRHGFELCYYRDNYLRVGSAVA